MKVYLVGRKSQSRPSRFTAQTGVGTMLQKCFYSSTMSIVSCDEQWRLTPFVARVSIRSFVQEKLQHSHTSTGSGWPGVASVFLGTDMTSNICILVLVVFFVIFILIIFTGACATGGVERCVQVILELAVDTCSLI